RLPSAGCSNGYVAACVLAASSGSTSSRGMSRSTVVFRSFGSMSGTRKSCAVRSRHDARMPSPATVTVGVMGSGSDELDHLATPLGQLLAQLGVSLLTGAGGGVMTSVSRAFTASPRTRGICIGIVPCANIEERDTAKDGYPNRFVELPIRTHLPYSGTRGQD